ncbi:hypothetical protein KY289_037079 [Solanum tuberosum]|nr:hypothetical protein KY289_037079 [Solanum tuberosum]
MNLVNSIFDGKGFPGWRRSLLIALSAKKKLGFINGNCKAPDMTHKDFEQWSCCNDMVISWILNLLSKEIGDNVIYSKTAKELWDSLENRFGRFNGAKLYHLQKELSGLVQANNDIAGYFTKLKRLWDELDSLNLSSCCTCVCMCEGKARSGNQANKGANTSQNFRNRGGGTSQNFGNLNQRSGKHFQKSRPRKVKYDPNVSCDHCGKTAISTEDNEDTHHKYGETFPHDYMQHLSKEQYSNLVHNVVKDAELTQSSISGSSFNVNAVAGPFNEEGTSFW